MNQTKAATEQRAHDLQQLQPWITEKFGGDGSLGDVRYCSPCRYRHGIMRDFGDLMIPAGVTLYAVDFYIVRATGSIWVAGHVNLDGASARPDGKPHGTRAPAARVVERGGGFLVTCDCGRVHLAVGGSSLAAWSPFVWGFGGEIFMCLDCGLERELRFDP